MTLSLNRTGIINISDICLYASSFLCFEKPGESSVTDRILYFFFQNSVNLQWYS